MVGYTSAIHSRWVRGDLFDFGEMSHQIDALLTIQPETNRILVFVDSEGADPKATLKSTRSVSRRLNKVSGGVPVSYIVVDHSLEGWLACDTDALKSVLGRDATIRIQGNPEDHLRPAQLLAQIFAANRKNEFKKTVDNRKIAELVSPDNIGKRSPTFRRLVRILQSDKPK